MRVEVAAGLGVAVVLGLVAAWRIPATLAERALADQLDGASAGGEVVLYELRGSPSLHSALLTLYGVPHQTRTVDGFSGVAPVVAEHRGEGVTRVDLPLVVVGGDLHEGHQVLDALDHLPSPRLPARSGIKVLGADSCSITRRCLEELDAAGARYTYRDLRKEPWDTREQAEFSVRGIRGSYRYPLVLVGGELYERPSVQRVLAVGPR